MISSGRCHGPGCTQTARTEFFCSEVCQLNWDRQAAGLAPVKPWPPSGYVSPVTRAGGFLIPAVERAAPEIQRGIERLLVDALNVDHIQTPLPPRPEATYSGTASSVMEDILRAYDLIEAMPAPEPVRLTRSQLDQLREHCPPPREPVPSGAIETLIGHRIELVELEEDSTPYQLGFRRGAVETFEGDGPEFEELPPALDGDSEERVCRTLTLPNGDTELLRRFPEPKGAISRAAYAPDPSRGWLSRVFDRLFGRTT